ncbi:MAG: hypothetical protein Kow0037_00410 [Calditrichia bacterium]
MKKRLIVSGIILLISLLVVSVFAESQVEILRQKLKSGQKLTKSQLKYLIEAAKAERKPIESRVTKKSKISPTEATTLLGPEDFSTFPGNWVVESQRVEMKWTQGTNSNYGSGTDPFAFFDDLSLFDPVSDWTTITSSTFSTVGYDIVELYFDYGFASIALSQPDTFAIEVSVDNGLTWNRVTSLALTTLVNEPYPDRLGNVLDITNFVGQNSQVKIRFFYDDGPEDLGGFGAIDNISVKGSVSTVIISSFPHTENFDAFPLGITSGTIANGWVNDSGDDGDWTVNSGATSTSNTGPSADHTSGSGKYLYLESTSGENPGNPNKSAYLVSPDIDLNAGGVTKPAVKFYYHMYGSDMGELHLDVWNGSSWDLDVMTAISGDQGNQWNEKVVNLTGYTGTIKIRFRGITGSGSFSDLAIDDVTIFDNNQPPSPTTLVSPSDGATGVGFNPTLEWNAASNATGYKIYFGTDNPPTNIANGTDLGNVTTYSPTGPLAGNTTYYWKVVPYNSNGDAVGASVWSFTTYDQVPNAATIVSPADASTNVSVSTDLQWADGGGNTTGYKLYFGTDNPPTNIVNGTDLGNVTSYTPSATLNYNTTYYWQVVAYNPNGDATTSTWSFTTEGNPNYGGGDVTSGGYYFANSTSGASGAPSQPTFSWVDISGTGSDIISVLDDDNSSGPYPIGFTFNYYGTDYTQFWVNSNGWITFTDPSGLSSTAQSSNQNFPDATTPNNVIALFWDDMNPDNPNVTGSHVYYDNVGNDLVITFEKYPTLGGDANSWLTAQVILKPSGNIKMQYSTHGSSLSLTGATVGIENADGTKGIAYNFNGSGGPIFSSPLAVEFGTNDASLPVALNTFTARAGNEKAILLWATQSEVDNAGFEVYRSDKRDGTYQLISGYTNNPELQGAGNSSSLTEYRFEDVGLVNGQTYWYKLADVDYNGHRAFHGPVSVVPNANGVQVVNDGAIPKSFALKNNYPNPFNPSTRLEFDIPALLDGSIRVNVSVYNLLGQKVKTLVEGNLQPGSYQVEWDGTNELGQKVASGVYLYGIRSEKFTKFKKMMLMK